MCFTRAGRFPAPYYIIRPLTQADAPFLREMLYQALYIPPGTPPLDRDVIDQPELAKYVQDWGREDDIGFIAIDANGQEPVGAAWLRLFRGDQGGYGYVDDQTPELSMALLPAYRGQGIGTDLLTHLLQFASPRYPAISLSVAPENPAKRLYQRFGFEVMGKCGSSLTMRKILPPGR